MALDTLRSIGSQYRAFQTRRLCARAAGIFAALIVTAPLHALSCAPYGVPEALDEVINAEEGYVVATGKLTFNKAKLPKVDMSRQHETPPTTQIKARLKGKALTKSGFTHALNTPLSLEVKCFGPWCASVPSDRPILAFLKQTNAGYILTTNPCGGHIFADPSAETLNSVAQCYINGTCPKSDLR